MRVALLGESTSMPSGFGTQMKIIADGLLEAGHDVVVLASTNVSKPVEGKKLTEWRLANVADLDVVNRTLLDIQPDCVIGFWYTDMVSQFLNLTTPAANCPMFVWLPWEGSTLPANANMMFQRIPKDCVVHLSKYAQGLWKGIFDTKHMIYHGVDLDQFKYVPPGERDKKQMRELRRKWSKRLRFPLFEDSVLILNVDRNINHKRWDATFDYVSQLQAEVGSRPVQLIAHTHKSDVNQGGMTGYDLPKIAKHYGIEDAVAYTDFDWHRSLSREELTELMYLCDLRITTSEGEGFGIPTIEAAACGTPQLVTDHTTMPELLGEGSKMIVKAAFREAARETLWYVPDVREYVARTMELLEKPDSFLPDIEKARKIAEENFAAKKIGEQWAKLVTESGGKSDKYWFTHRTGYKISFTTSFSLRDLALVILKIDQKMSVLDIGGFKGEFIAFALEGGIDVRGIEPEQKGIDESHDRSKAYIKQQKFEDEWPTTKAVVLTDVLDLIATTGPEAVKSALDRVATYKWAFIRTGKLYRYGMKIHEYEWVEDYLASKGMIRRHDLEKIAADQHQYFSHAIYSSLDTSEVPEGLLPKGD